MSILSTIHSLLFHKQLIFQKEKNEKKKEKNWTQLKISFRFNMTANMYVI